MASHRPVPRLAGWLAGWLAASPHDERTALTKLGWDRRGTSAPSRQSARRRADDGSPAAACLVTPRRLPPIRGDGRTGLGVGVSSRRTPPVLPSGPLLRRLPPEEVASHATASNGHLRVRGPLEEVARGAPSPDDERPSAGRRAVGAPSSPPKKRPPPTAGAAQCVACHPAGPGTWCREAPPQGPHSHSLDEKTSYGAVVVFAVRAPEVSRCRGPQLGGRAPPAEQANLSAVCRPSGRSSVNMTVNVNVNAVTGPLLLPRGDGWMGPASHVKFSQLSG